MRPTVPDPTERPAIPRTSRSGTLPAVTRRLRTAELLAIGTELTTGATRDTNSGDLARDLTAAGVAVLRTTALPDDLDVATAAIRAALERVDLVVVTGGLGPTPDDLTREAIAGAVGETPDVDPGILVWLEELWARRGLPFPASNRKQAWRIPSATSLPNPRGTAPGWWVDRPDGRVVVSLPGPPGEMRPMWRDAVRPRLIERGLGAGYATVTLRTSGIGESSLVDELGDLLAGSAPVVATYARPDGVDIRVSARDGPDGREAAAVAAQAVATIEARIGRHVWGRDEDTWPLVVGRALGHAEADLAIVEHGTGGAAGAILGPLPAVRRTVTTRPRSGDPAAGEGRAWRTALADDALAIRTEAGTAVGLAVAAEARPGHEDTRVRVAVVGPGDRRHVAERVVFRQGDEARPRVAAAAAQVLLEALAVS